MKASSLMALFCLFSLVFGQTTAPTTAPTPSPLTNELDWWGLGTIIIFYIIILGVSIWAARKRKDGSTEEMVLAGRNISGAVGVVTMIACWICAGYMYGTVQGIADPSSGLAWTQATWCYSICFFFGGLLFVKKMRERNYVTMLDPFQEKYGPIMTAFLYIPTVLGDLFWLGMTLATLGSALGFLLNIETWIAVVVSAVFAALYTFIGGLYAVVYIDLIQLTIMVVCIWVAIPFIWSSDAVGNVGDVAYKWVGSVAPGDWGIWLDYAFLMCFGGIPWQVYFQRVLACKTVKDAKVLSYASAVGVALVSIAPVILGCIAVAVDWSKTPIGELTDYSNTLSFEIKYLCPKVVSYIALGGLTAATMSTVDSSMLASATVFSVNIYKPLIHKKAGDVETMIVARIAVFVIAAAAVALALSVKSVYDLWVMTSDYIYCILFPQLLLVLYYNKCNTYGAFVGFWVALILRLGGGEAFMGLNAFIPYPSWMPFRTLAMVCSLLSIVIVSWIFDYLIVQKKCKVDFIGFYRPQIPTETPTTKATPVENKESPAVEEKKETTVEAPVAAPEATPVVSAATN
ncbi:hypothetical protein WA158_006588 [Blastocystis sp. Blastoise]